MEKETITKKCVHCQNGCTWCRGADYDSLIEIIERMKDIVHREYHSNIKEIILIESIELWIKETWRVAYDKGHQDGASDQRMSNVKVH